jgi:hypothetical protein
VLSADTYRFSFWRAPSTTTGTTRRRTRRNTIAYSVDASGNSTAVSGTEFTLRVKE